MRVARLFGPKDLKIIDMPKPEVGKQDVLAKVKCVGICGTDYSIYTGESSFVKNGLVKFPMTLGHEWSGIVEQVGENVTKIKKGDRVVGDTAVSCGKCYDCLCGNYIQCDLLRPVGTVNAWDGAYADFIIMPERHTFKIADNVSFEHAALVEPAATALYSIERGNVKPGDIVLVQGTGPIGLAAVHLLKLVGASCVILSGRKDFKLDIGKKLGADVTVNIKKENLCKKIMDITKDDGVHVIIEASGAINALKQSFKVVKPGGTISVVAFYEKMLDEFDVSNLVLNDIKLVGVAGSPKLGVTILELMKSNRIDLTPMITHKYSLDNVLQAFKDMKEKNATRIKMLLNVN